MVELLNPQLSITKSYVNPAWLKGRGATWHLHHSATRRGSALWFHLNLYCPFLFDVYIYIYMLTPHELPRGAAIPPPILLHLGFWCMIQSSSSEGRASVWRQPPLFWIPCDSLRRYSERWLPMKVSVWIPEDQYGPVYIDVYIYMYICTYIYLWIYRETWYTNIP